MFFKNLIFPDFQLIELVAQPIENVIKTLVTIYLARSMLDWLKFLFDQSNLIFDRSKIGQWVFKNVFLSRVLHTFQTFSKALSLFLLDRSNLSLFCLFLPNFSQVSLSSSVGKTFLPLLFQFIHNFHAFLLKFSNLRFLGFFNL